jgi:hypothetical protein
MNHGFALKLEEIPYELSFAEFQSYSLAFPFLVLAYFNELFKFCTKARGDTFLLPFCSFLLSYVL